MIEEPEQQQECDIPLDHMPFYLKNMKRDEIERILEKIKEVCI